MEKLETISFRKKIVKNTKETLEYIVKGPATTENIHITFYEGQEGDLRVRPYVKMPGNTVENLITFASGTDNFVSGNNEVFDQKSISQVDQDFKICLEVENVSAEFDYNLTADILIDYFQGKNRVGV